MYPHSINNYEKEYMMNFISSFGPYIFALALWYFSYTDKSDEKDMEQERDIAEKKYNSHIQLSKDIMELHMRINKQASKVDSELNKLEESMSLILTSFADEIKNMKEVMGDDEDSDKAVSGHNWDELVGKHRGKDEMWTYNKNTKDEENIILQDTKATDIKEEDINMCSLKISERDKTINNNYIDSDTLSPPIETYENMIINNNNKMMTKYEMDRDINLYNSHVKYKNI